MNNFFSELKRFVERCQEIGSTDGIFLEYRGAKISYEVAEEIYVSYFPVCDELQACCEGIEELRDFVRLLREENARLREGGKNVSGC